MSLPLPRRANARSRLNRRLASLRNLELFNVVFLPVCLVAALRAWGLPTWILVGYTLFLISFILVQGGFYWHLKLRAIRHRQNLPTYFHRLFLWLRRANVFLVALYPVLAAALFFAGRTSGSELIWATGFWLFALLEYINYYHVQLMHDTLNDLRYLAQHRKLRRAPLARDLARQST